MRKKVQIPRSDFNTYCGAGLNAAFLLASAALLFACPAEAADGTEAVLRVLLRTEAGRPACGRVLLFDGKGEVEANRPVEGEARFTLQSGTWRLVVTRGPAYGIYDEEVGLKPGETRTCEAVLRREISCGHLLAIDPYVTSRPSALELACEGLDAALQLSALPPGAAVEARSCGGLFTRAGLSRFSGSADRPELLKGLWGLFIGQGEDQAGWWSQLGADGALRHDWFHLLSRGRRVWLLAGSGPGGRLGMSRVYVPRRAGEKPEEALRAGPVSVSWGILVEVWAAGKPAGELVSARFGGVPFRVRVQAPRWVDTVELSIFSGSEVVMRTDLRPAQDPLRLDRTYFLHPKCDTVYVAAVSGKGPLLPYKPLRIRPLGIAGPVWVDADGDGRFTPAQQEARRLLETWRFSPPVCLERLAREPVYFRVQAAAQVDDPAVADHIADDLSAPVRLALLDGLLERRPPWALDILARRLVKCDKEPLEQALIVTGFARFGVSTGFKRFASRLIKAPLFRRVLAVGALLPHCTFPRAWDLLGPFSDPDGLGIRGRWGPEGRAQPGETYRDVRGKRPAWRKATPRCGRVELVGEAEPAVWFGSVRFTVGKGALIALCARAPYGFAAWIDNRKVVSEEGSEARALFVPWYLEPGEHKLVIEIPSRRRKGWFVCGFLDPTGTLKFAAP